ncbi:hypothetical protein FACS189430_02400 [Bacteroidia bacterium]|nr:hypothetical protein FACS189430_02400 [Bacteroidia bacterium]
MLESLLGFGQLTSFIGNADANFRLGGSFGNPGAYAGYLAVVAPLILSALLTYHRLKKAENIHYILYACMIFIMYMLFLAKSRGAFLAFGLGCFWVLNNRFAILDKIGSRLNTGWRKMLATLSIILMVSAGGYILYQLKADSAFGRTLVWKITAAAPHDHLLAGNGAGYFEANYGKWQSTYFAQSGGTEAERYVADYVTCAYNEFIATALEQGIPACVLMAALIFLAFRQKSKNNSALAAGAKASLAAIVVLMCVSYPFNILPVYLYFVFCLAVIFYNPSGFCLKMKRMAVSQWIVCLLAALIFAAGVYHLYGVHHLRKGQQQVFANQPHEAVKHYEKAALILKNSGIFHFYYGSALALTQQYSASAAELEASVKTSSNPHSYIMLGNVYKELGRTEAAKQAYLTAVYMTPSKLFPKYLLAKLLADASEPDEAAKWAQEIIAAKEKIPTTAAKEIKEEMKLLLQSIENKRDTQQNEK